jgi:alpha-ketoglutarate-dependent sulfate ester dioxygenase
MLTGKVGYPYNVGHDFNMWSRAVGPDAALMAGTTRTPLAVEPLTARIGAVIQGVDLREPLDEAAVAAIRQAWLRWKVAIFPGQHLDHEQHVAFTRQFGDITDPQPYYARAEGKELHAISSAVKGERYAGGEADEWEAERSDPAQLKFQLENRIGPDGRLRDTVRDDYWHADFTCAVNPPAATLLRAVQVPGLGQGGDTMWTDTVAAYAGLPPSIREFADKLWAEHRYGNLHVPLAADEAYTSWFRQDPLVAVHPVVRVHPETGQRALYVNSGFTRHILWLSPRQSHAILDMLLDHVSLPEYTVRHRWQPGDVAMWDNRQTQHLAPTDHFASFGTDRLLYRTMLAGDVPVAVDGRSSRLIEGAPLDVI